MSYDLLSQAKGPFIHAPNDVLTPFDLRSQILWVNVELSAHYRGQFFLEKIFDKRLEKDYFWIFLP